MLSTIDLQSAEQLMEILAPWNRFRTFSDDIPRSSTATRGAPVKTRCWTTSTAQHLRIVSFEPKRNIMQARSSSCRKQSKCIRICMKDPLPSHFEAKLIIQRPQTDHNSRTNLVSIWISFLIHFGTNFGWEGFGHSRRNQI